MLLPRLDPGQALVGNHETIDPLSADEVLLDDLVDVAGGHVAVPHRVGIDDHGHALRALVEAARLVGAHDALESARVEGLSEGLDDLLGAAGAAAAARVVGPALV